MSKFKFNKLYTILTITGVLIPVIGLSFLINTNANSGPQYRSKLSDSSSFLETSKLLDEIASTNSTIDSIPETGEQASTAITPRDDQQMENIDRDLDPNFVDIVFDPQQITPPAPFSQTSLDQSKSVFTTLAVPNTLVGFSSSSLQPMQQGVAIPTSFTVSFEQAPTEDLISALQFYPETEFTTSLNGRNLTVIPTRLNRYSEYVFGLRRTVICSDTNCSGETEKWSYSIPFRTAHWEKIVYGYSVLNRPLEAWIFGSSNSSGKRIMLTGATHGEEWHAGGLWMLRDFMMANPQELLGKNKTFVIIPYVNIDGTIVQKTTGSYGLDARYNARGVNLNRSFPSGWIPCPVCGGFAASEPETDKLIDIIKQESITHMIAYHNQWPPRGIIFMGNTRKPATQNMAYWVSQRTGYPVGVYNGPEVATTSSVPGDQVVWAESQGTTSILIEGTYRGVTDWNKNYPMYLALIREF